MSSSIQIKRIKNPESYNIILVLHADEPSQITILSKSFINPSIALSGPGEIWRFHVTADEPGKNEPHKVELMYEVEDSMNQFFYRVDDRDDFVPTDTPTTPGKDIQLTLNSDGVVIVGTGDFEPLSVG